MNLLVIESRNKNSIGHSALIKKEHAMLASIDITVMVNGNGVPSYEAFHKQLIWLKDSIKDRSIKNIIFSEVGVDLDQNILEEIAKYVFENTNINLVFK